MKVLTPSCGGQKGVPLHEAAIAEVAGSYSELFSQGSICTTRISLANALSTRFTGEDRLRENFRKPLLNVLATLLFFWVHAVCPGKLGIVSVLLSRQGSAR